MQLPLEVRRFFGHALNFAQNGEQHDAVKVLKRFLCCIVFKRRARVGFALHKGRWISFMRG